MRHDHPVIARRRHGYTPTGTSLFSGVHRDDPLRCPVCTGSGELSRRTGEASSSHGLREYVACSTCKGTGRIPLDELRVIEEEIREYNRRRRR